MASSFQGAMAIHPLLHNVHHQPSIEPTRAKQMPQGSSVIGWQNWSLTGTRLLYSAVQTENLGMMNQGQTESRNIMFLHLSIDWYRAVVFVQMI